MNNIKDSILTGSIPRVSIKLGMPILIGHLLIIMYNIIDTIFISFIDRESTALMSGVGLVFPIFFLYLALSTGLMTGMSSLVARAIGEKNQKILDRVADSGLVLMTVISVLTLIVAYSFGKPIIQILAGSKISSEAVKYAINYFFFFAPGLACLIMELTLFGILQGEGLTQYFGTTMVFSNILNLILDPILIFGFKMGVPGAALASTLSIFASVIFVISIFIQKKSSIIIHWNIFKAKFKIILEILRIGIPQILSMIALSISFMFLNKLISSINEITMNAWVIFGRTSEILMLTGYAMSNSTLTMIGQNYGSNNLERVKKIYNNNILISIIGTAIIAILYNIFANLIFSLFTDVPQVIDLGVLQVRILAFAYIGGIVSIIVSSTFQATGKAMPSFYITVFRMGILTIPLSYACIFIWNYGFIGILYSFVFVNIITLIGTYLIGYFYLKNLKMRKIEA